LPFGHGVEEILEMSPSPRLLVYVMTKEELEVMAPGTSVSCASFMVAECSDANEEKILRCGAVHGHLTFDGRGFACFCGEFEDNGGKFNFYCQYEKKRGRLKTCCRPPRTTWDKRWLKPV
jgi:hypothetical protein